jgi:MFS family permease
MSLNAVTPDQRQRTDQPSAPVQAGGSGLILFLLALSIASASAMRTVFSPVQEVAKASLGLSDSQIGMVQGLAASIPIALLSLPLGRLIDRSNRVRLLFGLGVIWTVGTVATAFSGGFLSLFLTRMLAGLGAYCAIPVAISLAADLSTPERRGRSLLALSFGQYVGAALAFALGGGVFGALSAPHAPLLFGLAPWRALQLLFGLGSAVLLLPLLLTPEPVRHEVLESNPALGPALREIWDRRAFLLPLFVGQVGVVMADTAAGIWAAPVLTRDYHLQPSQFAGWMGLTLLLAGVVGSLVGGVGADLGQKSRLRGGLLLGAVIASALTIPAALFPLMPTVAGFAGLLGLLLACGAAAGLITATAIAVLVPNEIRGVCLGAFVVLGAIIGFGVAPSLVTWGSALLGGEAHLARSLAIVGVGINVISAAAFLWAMLKLREKPSSI